MLKWVNPFQIQPNRSTSRHMKWFDPSKRKTRKSIYKKTVLQTYQGSEGTCYAHMGTRLILQNIMRLKDEEKYSHNWKYRSVCRRMLNTYKPPIPTKELKQCGVDGFLKISMFLYIYYLIIERYGLDGGDLSQCLSIYSRVKEKERPRKFTEPYQAMYTTVESFLTKHDLPPFYYNQIFMDSTLENEQNKSLFDLLLLFLEHNMYIGCRFYTDNNIANGHLFILTGYSASQNAFYVKNSWGMFVSMLKVSEIGKNTITFDTDGKIKARVNMFAFVYTRKNGPLLFDTVTPDIVDEFQHVLERP